RAAWVEGDFADRPVPLAGEGGGVFAAEVEAARAGSRYRFLLDGDAGRLTRLDPYCRRLTRDRAWCTVVDPASYAWAARDLAPLRREELVVYELHVGSFTAEGTLAAARARLDALAELGVNAVELMPVHAFGGGARNWGYNPHLFLAVQPELGEPDELRAFVDAAHARGIAVLLDLVINHADGWRQAPLACFDGHCPDGSWGVHFFPPGPYATTPWGPRPSYPEPQVAAMLEASARQWLAEYRGDGFRVDSVSNIRAIDGNGTTPGGREVLLAINQLTRAAGGVAIAEDLKGWDGITAPAARGGLGFDAQWDGFGWEVMNLLVPYSDAERDLGVVARQLAGGYRGDGFARLLFTETHDTVGNGGARLPSRIDPGDPESAAARRRSMLGAVLLMTTPGVPMLFMGQEQLATGGLGNPAAPLAAPTARGLEVRAFYRDLIALRRDAGGRTAGLLGREVSVLHRNDGNKVIAYRRGGEVVVVLNLRNRGYPRYDIGVPAGGTWRVAIDSDWRRYGSDFGGGQSGPLTALAEPRDGQPFTLPLRLAPYGALVLTR
ncbi:MAG TPA: alpha-amylase family glycosyl hydrolase, partial [Kofleriaceae bacterium]|nr:alpha-amylase family glycosyl hydrolase [Kofleriaceae bacterium]